MQDQHLAGPRGRRHDDGHQQTEGGAGERRLHDQHRANKGNYFRCTLLAGIKDFSIVNNFAAGQKFPYSLALNCMQLFLRIV
jgi:hypothetical protein